MSEPGQDAALGGILEQGRQLVRPLLGVRLATEMFCNAMYCRADSFSLVQ